ncbi:putative ubiquinone biosynthesis protein Coq7 [Hortaea werneckii]|nr:putative ubiquinone biosynthesis protein Coq7 [Hortaea werneckii]
MATLLPRAAGSPALPLKSRLNPLAFQLRARSCPSHRTIVSSSASPSTEPNPSSLHKPQNPRRKQLSPEQKQFLDSALRVNHAGELAATLIYTAQSPPINKAYPHLRPLMKHMYDQEAGHFKYFNEVLARHRIRPTAMYPLWHAAATFLGWSTGVMGREGVTEVDEEMEAKGEDIGEELRQLVAKIRSIRDEELEHLDHAVENDAKEANPYELLTGVIRWGCKGAIKISERV